MVPPLEDRGFQKAGLNKTKAFFDGTVGPIVVEYVDPKITVDGNHAYVTAHLHFAFTMKDGKKTDVTGRVTDVYERIDGEWTVVHEHSSVPTTIGFTWGEK